MPNEVTIISKEELAEPPVVIVGAWLLWLYLACALAFIGLDLVLAVMSQNLLLTLCSTMLFAIGFWLFTPTLLCLPVGMYLRENYRKRNYHAIDNAHTRVYGLIKRLPVRKDWQVITLLSNLALSRLAQGYYDNAEIIYKETIELSDKNKRLSKGITPVILYNNLSICCLKQQNYVEAELHATEALELAEKLSDKNRFLIGLPLAAIGIVRLKLNELDSAEEYLRKALTVYETTQPPLAVLRTSRAHAIAGCTAGMALVKARQDNVEESLAYCEKVYSLVRIDPSALNTLSLEVIYLLANEYMRLDKFEQAEHLLEIGYTIAHEFPYHPDSKQLLNYYEKLLLLTNRQGEVEDMRSWLRQVEPKVPLQVTAVR